MKVKFKKLNKLAVLPSYAKHGDAGMDITATSKNYDDGLNTLTFRTGLAVEIPEGHVCLLFPRSSICKTQLSLANSVGVLDSGYRGEIKFMFRAGDRPVKNYEIGDRIGQILILPYPTIETEWADELSSTERGTGGFGSSGK